MTDDQLIEQLTREYYADQGFRIDESPFSSSTTDNWVARLGGLPPYIRGVTRGILKTNGGDFQAALSTAIQAIKLWAAGKMPWSKNHAGHPTAATQAKAQAALAQWEKMKAEAHGGSRTSVVISTTRAVRVGYNQMVGQGTSTNTPTGTVPHGQVKGAYATGHPFHGNQHTGPIIGPHQSKQQKQQNAHQKAHQTAHNTASATAKATAARKKGKSTATANQKQAAASSGNLKQNLAQQGSGPNANADQAAANAQAAQDVAATNAALSKPVTLAQIAATTAKAAGNAGAGAAGGAGNAAAAAQTARQNAIQNQGLLSAITTAQAALDAASQSAADSVKQQQQNVSFAAAKVHATASAQTNEQGQQSIAAAQTNATVANDQAAQRVAQAKAALLAAQAAAHAAGLRGVFREIDEHTTVLELRDFLGESTPGDAAAFLPNGPTAYQDARIKRKLTEPTQRPTDKQPDRAKMRHIPQGNDLNHCEKCGEPFTSPIHQAADAHASIINEPANTSKTVMQTLTQQYGSLRGVFSDDMVDTHRFMGQDLMSCSTCGNHILHKVHSTDEGSITGVQAAALAASKKAPGQPIPPVPRMLRSADGSSISDVHSTNTKNIELVSSPLEGALQAHFDEQRKATINRLMGKRGGKMLQRARAEYPELPRDLEELSTTHGTTPHGDPKLDPAEIEEELSTPAGSPAVVLNPRDVFDDSHWTDRTTSILEPHLVQAALLGAQNVKAQVNVPSKTADETGLTLGRAQMAERARDAAQAITSTTAKHIAGAIQEGVAAGEDRDQIRARVEHVFDVAKDQRAQQIAQTVAMGGYNQAALTYARNLPDGMVTSKTWLSDADPSTRLEHRLAHHQTRRLDDAFQVGGASLDYPGDSTAPVDSWINCRCSQAFA